MKIRYFDISDSLNIFHIWTWVTQSKTCIALNKTDVIFLKALALSITYLILALSHLWNLFVPLALLLHFPTSVQIYMLTFSSLQVIATHIFHILFHILLTVSCYPFNFSSFTVLNTSKSISSVPGISLFDIPSIACWTSLFSKGDYWTYSAIISVILKSYL